MNALPRKNLVFFYWYDGILRSPSLNHCNLHVYVEDFPEDFALVYANVSSESLGL